MNETLIAVIIGGTIAIVGSAATQIILFWLTGRREKKGRRRLLLEYRGRMMTKKAFLEKRDQKDMTKSMFASIEESKRFSDDQGSVTLGSLKYYVDDFQPPTSPDQE